MVGVNTNPEDREPRSRDFGGMVTQMPGAVATPASVEEVSRVVRDAASDGQRLAIRGGGHSQGGQSLIEGGLVLDTARLDRVRVLGSDLVRAQGGTRWGAVVAALEGTGRLPRVLADFAEMSVGGTLSAGGLGTTSHRYGIQIGQVERLEVVTGSGERVQCSRTENAALFNAVRGGQGQFGIITEAWIRMRSAGRRFRQYEFRYRDFERFVSDFETVIDDGRFDHLRAETRAHDRQIVLRAGAEYDKDIDNRKMFDGLGYDRMAIVWDTANVGHAGMYPRWGFTRQNFHPWRDWLLPWEILRTVLDQPWLEPDWVPPAPRSWIGIYPIATGSIDAPLFMRPEGDRMLSYSVLVVLNDRGQAVELAGRLKEIDRTLVGRGGKGYLSGGFGYGRREWEEHYGERLETGRGWKKAFDPNRVFEGGDMPFGDGA